MSTTFDVFPQSASIPSYWEILELSTQELRGFLAEFGIAAMPTIAVNLYRRARYAWPESAEEQPLDPNWPARWVETDSYWEFAWFSVPPILGGTDAYFRLWTPGEYDDELLHAPQGPKHKALITAWSKNDHYWSFRRSAGQPAIINLAYGLIAASLAQLTDGLIYSGDGAWDYERFPATASEFFSWYFRPEMALEPDNKQWSARCISYVAEELIR